ncbi:MAG: hypothetical protein LC715_01690, partial [Gammaproteobacteria bacterium]|nr:hypothetical protein [Gammaproteobacteria bacterium]
AYKWLRRFHEEGLAGLTNSPMPRRCSWLKRVVALRRERQPYRQIALALQMAVTSGDYDGNGRLDLTFTTTANDLYVWLGDGNGFAASTSSGRSSPGWSLRW